jgi:hypothetical protein
MIELLCENQRLQRLTDILDSSPDFIFVCTADGSVTYASERLSELHFFADPLVSPGRKSDAADFRPAPDMETDRPADSLYASNQVPYQVDPDVAALKNRTGDSVGPPAITHISQFLSAQSASTLLAAMSQFQGARVTVRGGTGSAVVSLDTASVGAATTSLPLQFHSKIRAKEQLEAGKAGKEAAAQDFQQINDITLAINDIRMCGCVEHSATGPICGTMRVSKLVSRQAPAEDVLPLGLDGHIASEGAVADPPVPVLSSATVSLSGRPLRTKAAVVSLPSESAASASASNTFSVKRKRILPVLPPGASTATTAFVSAATPVAAAVAAGPVLEASVATAAVSAALSGVTGSTAGADLAYDSQGSVPAPASAPASASLPVTVESGKGEFIVLTTTQARSLAEDYAVLSALTSLAQGGNASSTTTPAFAAAAAAAAASESAGDGNLASVKDEQASINSSRSRSSSNPMPLVPLQPSELALQAAGIAPTYWNTDPTVGAGPMGGALDLAAVAGTGTGTGTGTGEATQDPLGACNCGVAMLHSRSNCSGNSHSNSHGQAPSHSFALLSSGDFDGSAWLPSDNSNATGLPPLGATTARSRATSSSNLVQPGSNGNLASVKDEQASSVNRSRSRSSSNPMPLVPLQPSELALQAAGIAPTYWNTDPTVGAGPMGGALDLAAVAGTGTGTGTGEATQDPPEKSAASTSETFAGLPAEVSPNVSAGAANAMHTQGLGLGLGLGLAPGAGLSVGIADAALSQGPSVEANYANLPQRMQVQMRMHPGVATEAVADTGAAGAGAGMGDVVSPPKASTPTKVGGGAGELFAPATAATAAVRDEFVCIIRPWLSPAVAYFAPAAAALQNPVATSSSQMCMQQQGLEPSMDSSSSSSSASASAAAAPSSSSFNSSATFLHLPTVAASTQQMQDCSFPALATAPSSAVEATSQSHSASFPFSKSYS